MDQEYYIKKWLQGTLTDEERAAFEQTDDFKDLQRIDQALEDFKAPSWDQDQTYKQIEAAQKPAAKEVSINHRTVWWKVAAVLIPLLTLIYFWSQDKTNISLITAGPERVEHLLPDQSEVILNVESYITYATKNWPKERDLDLDGEAYFKVASGSSFSVQTDQGTVTVLGTEFNVKNRHQYFEVICYEGKVRVNTPDQELVLTAGQMFRIIEGTVVKDKQVSATVPSWINKVSSFVSVPYQQVLLELERQYGVRIEAGFVDQDQLFSGSFPHQNLELALKSITQPLNLSYKVKADKTVILQIEDN